MANSLLDFVMSLVRDPDAAARYAADPAQAIADAHLADVTSADVDNLIPVVSESLSVAAPMTALDPFGGGPAGNVWASGAATAAFDAFADHVPAGFDDTQPDHVLPAVSDTVDEAGPSSTDAAVSNFDATSFDVPVIEEAPADAPPPADDWDHPVVDDHHVDGGDAGFDLFD